MALFDGESTLEVFKSLLIVTAIGIPGQEEEEGREGERQGGEEGREVMGWEGEGSKGEKGQREAFIV